MNQQIIWKQVNHPDILPGYLVSPEGYIKASSIKDDDCIKEPSYHSTNGYDFMLLNNKDGNLQLFPLDDIIALAYIPIPSSLQSKRIKVLHINGDTRDISLDNLQWVEDIEEWIVCTYPGVKPDMYEVSSWGRIRNKGSLYTRTIGINTQGYFRIVIDGREYRVHRLVAWEFCEFDLEFSSNHVNHINGKKTTNIPKNLEVVTTQDNTRHAEITGLSLKGDRLPNATITNEVATFICTLIIKHKGVISEISKELIKEGVDVPLKIIQNIKEKQSWNIISDKYFKKDEYRSYPKYSKKDIEEICKLNLKYPKQCKKIKLLAKKLGINISLSAIKHIVYKYTWKEISDKYF
jgi:hypothetical protein